MYHWVSPAPLLAFFLPLSVHIPRDLPDLPFTPSYSLLSSLLELSLQSEPSRTLTSLGCSPGAAPQQIRKERDYLSFLCTFPVSPCRWMEPLFIRCSSQKPGVGLVPAPSSSFIHTSPQAPLLLPHPMLCSGLLLHLPSEVTSLPLISPPQPLFQEGFYLITCPSSAQKPL